MSMLAKGIVVLVARMKSFYKEKQSKSLSLQLSPLKKSFSQCFLNDFVLFLFKKYLMFIHF